MFLNPIVTGVERKPSFGGEGYQKQNVPHALLKAVDLVGHAAQHGGRRALRCHGHHAPCVCGGGGFDGSGWVVNWGGLVGWSGVVGGCVGSFVDVGVTILNTKKTDRQAVRI